MRAISAVPCTFALIVCALVVPGEANAAVALYTLTDLGPILGGVSSRATGVNNAGQVVGSGQSAGGDVHAFLYRSGTMTDIHPGGAFGSEAAAINNAGQVVGVGPAGAFRYDSGNGTWTDLGAGTAARGINDAGQIVGTDAAWVRAVTWTAGGTMSYLDQQLPAGSGWTLYEAIAINNSGQVTGTGVAPGGSAQHAFRFSGGAAVDLGALSSYAHTPFAINDAGDVVGVYYAGANQGFLYSNGVISDIGTLGSNLDCMARDINNLGQIVGQSVTTPGTYHAFVWKNGTIADLNALVTPPPSWFLFDAAGINDLGQIAGTMQGPGGVQHAYLLTPVPEPSAALLGLAGALGVSASFIRRRRTR